MTISRTDYGGVGPIKNAVQSILDFTVTTPESERPALQILQHREPYKNNAHR